MYSIELKQNAEKQLKKLPIKIREWIIKKLLIIQYIPYSFLKKYSELDVWSLRLGKDYRILLDIDESKKIIYILNIKKRDKL